MLLSHHLVVVVVGLIRTVMQELIQTEQRNAPTVLIN